MIYLFTWTSQLKINESIKLWKTQFIDKYWDFNLIHLKNINELDKNLLFENILSSWFLCEKKLIIIDIDDDIKDDYENIIIENLNKIPDENIVIFSYWNPDKRKKIFKELSKISEIKLFDDTIENSKSYLENKYKWKISKSAVELLLKYKSNNLYKSKNEIEKLLIWYDFIDDNIIEKFIYPELEESIFLLIDDILNSNLSWIIYKIEIILNNTNVYAFYNNLLANLRNLVFIELLKSNKLKNNEITNILSLWNKTFLINKVKNNKILINIYLDLIDIDKKMKSWLLLWSDDINLKFEIEKILIKAIKNS